MERKKSNAKRFLSILLTCLMIFTLPSSALASDLDFTAEAAPAEVQENAESAEVTDAEVEEPQAEEPTEDEYVEEEPAEGSAEQKAVEEEDSQELDMAEDSGAGAEEIAEENSEETQDLDLADDFSAGEQDAFNAGEETTGTAAAPADVYVTISNKGVLAKTKDNQPMAHQKVTVKDLNSDGVLTYDEALVAAHEAYAQADGYVTENGQWGLTVKKLWGIDTTNTLYYLNGAALQSNVGDTKVSTVKANDYLVASINQDDVNYSDKYASFDAVEKTVKAGEEFTLTLNGAMTAGTKALSGIQIGTWKDGAFAALEGKTTGEDGTVKLSFSEPGTYYVTANGSVLDQIPDYSQQPDENWNYPTKENNCPLMAPVCVVTVKDTIAYGTCGKDLTWTLDKDGILTIEGTGEMTSCPWKKLYINEIKNVVIKSGVTSVYTGSFQNGVNITSVSLPDTLTTFKASVFRGCTRLTEITIPESVQTIGNNVFIGCTKLKEITIPASVQKIGNSVFTDCKKLTTVTLNGSEIGNYIFENCTALTTVNIGAAVPDITGSMFEGCGSLTTLTVDENNQNIKSIDNIVYSKDGKELKLCARTKSGDIVIPKETESLSDTAFNNCAGITSVTFQGTVKNFSAEAFSGCTAMEAVNFGFASGNYKTVDGIVYTTTGQLVYCPPAVKGEITIPEGVTEIEDSAFADCAGITAVHFPSTLQKIGSYAFEGCNGLTEIVIPDSVTELGSSAFRSCIYLKKAELTGNITSVPYSAFRNDQSLTEVVMKKGTTTVEEYAFYGCTSLEKLEFPEGLTYIDNYVFGNCSSLRTVIFPAELQKFSYSTFGNFLTVGKANAYFRGSRTDWAKISYVKDAKFKSVQYCYGVEEDNSLITTQPVDTQYAVDGSASENPVKVTLKKPENGETYEISWVKTSSKEKANGTLVSENTTVSEDGTEATYVQDTKKAGNFYYYAEIVKKNADGKILSQAATDVVTVTVAVSAFEGKGTAEEPYQIKSLKDLETLRDLVKAGTNMKGVVFQMTADITLPADWESIGYLPEDKVNPRMSGREDSENGKNILPFSGTFDGNGKTATVAKGGQPLFAYVRSATIRNLNIQGEYIKGDGLVAYYVVDYGPDGNYGTGDDGGSYASGCPDTVNIVNVTIKSGTVIRDCGFLGGYASGANVVNISGCTVEKNVKIGWDAEANAPSGINNVGSLAGEFNGTVINCTSYADVYGAKAVGGLIGSKGQSMGPYEIRNSSFHGTVTATGVNTGGIAGSGYTASSAPNTPGATIENCYVTGTITGTDAVGGIFGGEYGQAQAWNLAYIRNNCFYGTVKGTETGVGGIIGYMKSLNINNVVENNYYLDSCGAKNGIGRVLYVDTDAVEHGWTEDKTTYYMNTSKDSLDKIKEETDPDNRWKSITKTDMNRSDDPLGKDADKLAKAMTDAQFKDNTVTDELNRSDSSMGNWEQKDGYPTISEQKVAYRLTVSGDYKTIYYVGDKLDFTGMEFKVSWSDGTTSNVTEKDVTVTGFDSSTRGRKTLTVSYQSVKAEVEVVVKKNTLSTIKVSFTLLGDEEHNSDEDGVRHTLAAGNLETWIPKTTYEVDANATVLDVLKKALSDNGMTFRNTAGNYVQGITKDEDSNELAEFTNGKNSGWMYTLNGKHPDLSVIQQYLDNGDEIVFHYTDNYPDEHEHNWSSKWSNDKTAHWHVCTSAGCMITDKKEMDGYAAHTFDKGTVTKKATYKATGVKTYTCTVCGYKKTATIAKLKCTKHTYVWKTTTKATVFAPAKQTQVCSKCGYKGKTRNYGKKLTPTLKLNTTKFTLKVKQSTSKVRVTGLANGDSVKSWTSSNKSVAAVNSKGVITAGSKAGTAKITVTLKSGKKGYITVTVQKATVKTVKITGVKSALTLTKGKTTTLKPVVSPFTSGEKVTYTSSNKNVATVNSKGVITAKKKGTAVITVKSGTRKVTCKVTVK